MSQIISAISPHSDEQALSMAAITATGTRGKGGSVIGLTMREAASFLSAGDLEGAQSIACSATGDDVRYSNNLARVTCPAHCERDRAAIAYGAGIHPSQSAVCLSLVVDHVLPVFGGEAILTKVPGLPSYVGKDVGYAASLGAADLPGDAYHAYAVDSIDLSRTWLKAKKATCTNSFRSLDLWQNGDSIIVDCVPDGCKGIGELNGRSIYTKDSSVCRAAEHQSITSELGGKVIVTRRPGQDVYVSSSTRRDSSSEHGPTSEAYTVAFPASDVLSREALVTRFR